MELPGEPRLQIALGPILKGIFTGNILEGLVKSIEVEMQFTSISRQRKILKRIMKRCQTSFRNWRKVNSLSEDEYKSAMELAVDLLNTFGSLSARQIIDSQNDPEKIATIIVESSPNRQMSGKEKAQSFHIISSVLERFLTDVEFKNLIEFEIQIYAGKAGDIRGEALIGVSDAVGKMSRGEPDPTITDEHLACAEIATQGFVDDFNSRLHDQPTYVGRLETHKYVKLLTGQRWQQRVDDSVRSILHYQESQSKNAVGLRRILYRAPRSYDGIRNLLRENQGALKPERNKHHDQEGRGEWRQAQQANLWLTREAVSPRYRACLPIVGGWGAGKTVLASDVAILAAAQGGFVIKLQRVEGKEVDEALLSEARKLFGRRFDSVNELENGLSGRKKYVIIIVDRADDWSASDSTFIRQLQERIINSTKNDVLRWIIIADETKYYLVTNPDKPKFWEEYGWGKINDDKLMDDDDKESISIPGWIDLDRLNIEETIGHSILSKVRLETDRPRIMRATVDAFRVSGKLEAGGEWELLCQPLAAWTYARTYVSTDAIFDQTTFINKYWSIAISKIGFTPGHYRLLEDIIENLVMISGEYFGNIGKIDNLYSACLPRLPSPERVNELNRMVDGLKSARFLRNGLDGVLRLGAENLWARRIVDFNNTDIYNDKKATLKSLREWLSVNDSSTERLRDSVVSERLLLIGSEPKASNMLEGVLSGIYDARGRNVSIWSAAPSLSIDQQSELTRIVIKNPPASTSAHDTYLFLRWCLHSPEGVWRPEQKLSVICERFNAIGNSGLGTYLLIILKRLFKHVDLSDARNQEYVLSLLQGCEVTGVGGDIAREFIKNAREQSDHELVVMAVYSHLVKLSPRVIGLGLGPHVEWGEGFLASLIEYTLECAMGSGVREGVASLNKVGWMRTRSADGGLSFTLRAKAHNAIGHCFDEGPEGVEVARIVLHLTGGGIDELISAIFIIRHTVPTHGQQDVVVSEIFRPSLARLKDLQLSVPSGVRKKWLWPLLEANDI